MLRKNQNADTIPSFFFGGKLLADFWRIESQFFGRTWSESVDIRAKDAIILFAAV